MVLVELKAKIIKGNNLNQMWKLDALFYLFKKKMLNQF